MYRGYDDLIMYCSLVVAEGSRRMHYSLCHDLVALLGRSTLESLHS